VGKNGALSKAFAMIMSNLTADSAGRILALEIVDRASYPNPTPANLALL
jgi:hypothetical protein